MISWIEPASGLDEFKIGFYSYWKSDIPVNLISFLGEYPAAEEFVACATVNDRAYVETVKAEDCVTNDMPTPHDLGALTARLLLRRVEHDDAD